MGQLSPATPDSLADLLDSEIEAVTRFTTLLEREQAELRAGRADALEGIVAEKTPLVQQLNQLAEQRNQQIVSAGFTPDRAGIESFIATRGTPLLQGAWATLQAQARQAQQLNELNGQLITQRLSTTTGALQILLQRSPSASTGVYGPDGQKQGGTGSRLIDSV